MVELTSVFMHPVVLPQSQGEIQYKADLSGFLKSGGWSTLQQFPEGLSSQSGPKVQHQGEEERDIPLSL